MSNRLGWSVIVAAVLWVLLALVSWIVAAALPEAPIRAIVSDNGLRWLAVSLEDSLQRPLLVWIVLGMVSAGAFRCSGLAHELRLFVCRKQSTYRARVGMALVATVLSVFIVLLCLTTLVPHAPLLGITGNLIPGPLQQGAIPLACLVVTLCSVTFAAINGECHNPGQLMRILCYGPKRWNWLLPIYIVWMELAASIAFVFEIA